MSKWADMKAAEEKKKQQEQEKINLKKFEDGMQEQLTDLQREFRERAEKEEKRFNDVCDSNYYFTVCFSNQDQMREFCESVGLNPEELYIDGREFARKIGRALKTKDTEFARIRPFSKDYVDRAMHGSKE